MKNRPILLAIVALFAGCASIQPTRTRVIQDNYRFFERPTLRLKITDDLRYQKIPDKNFSEPNSFTSKK